MSLKKLALLVVLLLAAVCYCTSSYLRAEGSLRVSAHPVGARGERCNAEAEGCVAFGEEGRGADPACAAPTTLPLRSSLAGRSRDVGWRIPAALSTSGQSADSKGS